MQGQQRSRPVPARARHHLVLAGGGHTHALLLRMWAMRPARRPAFTAITLVSRHGTAFYSGTVPALVAGLLERDRSCIDLRLLCLRAGASFVQAEITGLDIAGGALLLAERPPLRFDRLSLDVGAVTVPAGSALPVKPLEPFLDWCRSRAAGKAVRIRGGGAAAVEVALALRARGLAPRLLLQGSQLQLGSMAASRAGERLLAAAGIPVERQVAAEAPADLACTGSQAPLWLAEAGLPVEPRSGRVRTEATLAVQGHPHLFAAGDCGWIATDPRPASGVWAVRAAPVLAENLRRSLETPDPRRPGRPPSLLRWRPQARALQLLGDGGASGGGAGSGGAGGGAPRALACWGPFVLGPSRWLWRWKEHIDRRFLERFSVLGPMPSGQPTDDAAMACRGCAAKLAAQPLAAALERLEPGATPAAEDAAALGRSADGGLLLQSVDGFPALVDDPWLNARLTTLHACSDLWACGAAVESVQALVTVPEVAPSLQEELLLQTLAGVRSVLAPLGARLIGGHTLEGRDGAGLALALTVNGRVAAGDPWPKGPLHPGDALLLSRPLGSGVLFAAAMAGASHPDWIDRALEELQRSQAGLIELLRAHGCRACTDITGFGLLGHLGEMVGAAGLIDAGTVELDAEAIPVLDGALPLLERGYASSLAPANAVALALLGGRVRLVREIEPARRALLIDPQTCGPLLACLPGGRAEAALAALHRAGWCEAALIGRVLQVGA